MARGEWPTATPCEPDAKFQGFYIVRPENGHPEYDTAYVFECAAQSWRHYPGKVVPMSTKYICPVCGFHWAEVHIVHPGTLWKADLWLCPQHGFGTLLEGEDDKVINEAPYDILEREFLIALEYPNYW